MDICHLFSRGDCWNALCLGLHIGEPATIECRYSRRYLQDARRCWRGSSCRFRHQPHRRPLHRQVDACQRGVTVKLARIALRLAKYTAARYNQRIRAGRRKRLHILSKAAHAKAIIASLRVARARVRNRIEICRTAWCQAEGALDAEVAELIASEIANGERAGGTATL